MCVWIKPIFLFTLLKTESLSEDLPPTSDSAVNKNKATDLCNVPIFTCATLHLWALCLFSVNSQMRKTLVTLIVLFLLFLLLQTPAEPYAMCCVISRLVKQRGMIRAISLQRSHTWALSCVRLSCEALRNTIQTLNPGCACNFLQVRGEKNIYCFTSLALLNLRWIVG